MVAVAVEALHILQRMAHSVAQAVITAVAQAVAQVMRQAIELPQKQAQQTQVAVVAAATAVRQTLQPLVAVRAVAA